MDSLDLKLKLEDRISRQNGNTKYYHFNSILNFMKNIDNFGVLYYKEKAKNHINDYFAFIEEKDVLSRQDGVYIFKNFIQPLGKIYSHNFGFIIYLELSTILLYLIIWLVIAFFLLRLHFTVLIISVILCTILYLPFKIKKRKNKVYGFDF